MSTLPVMVQRLMEKTGATTERKLADFIFKAMREEHKYLTEITAEYDVKNQTIRNWLNRNYGDEYQAVRRQVDNYWLKQLINASKASAAR